jgi:hypothetical protein
MQVSPISIFEEVMKIAKSPVFLKARLYGQTLADWLDLSHDHGNGVLIIVLIVEKSFTMTLHAQIWPVLRNYID